MSTKEATALELVILAMFHRQESTTAYAVAREFADSPTPHWSGSVGAIYPAVARLTNRGHLRKEPKQPDQRRQTYALTRKGRAALRRWLKPPVPEAEALMTHDDIRTKIYFLALLTPEEQHAFLADALAKVKAQLPVLKSHVEADREAGDEWAVRAGSGILRMARARVRWLAELEQELRSKCDGSP